MPTKLSDLVKTNTSTDQTIFNQFDEQIALINSTLAQPRNGSRDVHLGHEFVKIFDVLFVNSSDHDSLFEQIKKTNDPEQVYHYLKRIVALMKTFESLPGDFKYKASLENGIYDRINAKWINKFKKGEYQLADFTSFIKENCVENIVNTVEVKTWGTKREISNGLRNVVDQKLSGEGVGHVSLMMRLAADDHGKALIRQYCLNNDGTVKIPYEIKKYGNQSVYEIYWSFWPSSDKSQRFYLSGLKSDFKSERGLSYAEDKEILAKMPSELKELYLLQRRRSGKTIDLAPAAVKKTSSVEMDLQRQEYLKLKMQKYRINEEIEALEVLLNRYLVIDKVSDELKLQDKPIKKDSNFLVLLKRFQHQIPHAESVARIIKSSVITSSDVNYLHDAVSTLIKTKMADSDHLKTEIKLSASKLQIDRSEIKTLKSQIKANRKIIQDICDDIAPVMSMLTLLKNIKRTAQKYPTTQIPKELTKLLKKCIDDMYELDGENIALAIATTNSIQSLSQIDFLISKQAEYIGKLQAQILPYQETLNQSIDKLHDLYSVESQTYIAEKEQKIAEADERIREAYYIIGIYEPPEYDPNPPASVKVELRKRETLVDEVIKLKLDARRSVEDLVSKNVSRELRDNNITLTNFNVEEMLKKASKITDTASRFDLLDENCSTTSMKILKAGAPQEIKSLFKWSEKAPGEDSPSNTFISNPQAVYSAARVADDYALGKAAAKSYVDKESRAKPVKKYNKLLNTIASSKPIQTTFEMIRIAISLIPYVFSFLADWMPRADAREKSPDDSFLVQLDRVVRSPLTHSYDLIQSASPVLAIQIMMNKLKANQTAIPFFSEETLTTVNDYILAIEANDSKNPDDETILDNYYKIIQERNARIQTVEEAIFSGKDPVDEITKRPFKQDSLVWSVNTEALVQSFTQIYTELRKQETLPELRSNFIKKLTQCKSNEAKLEAIKEHMRESPHSRTAAAWNKLQNELTVTDSPASTRMST